MLKHDAFGSPSRSTCENYERGVLRSDRSARRTIDIFHVFEEN